MRAVRWIVGTVLFFTLLAISLQNNDTATLKLYHWSWQAPLVFVVLLAFATGVAAGLLAGAVRAARLKRQLARLRRERARRDATPAPHGAIPGEPLPRAGAAPGYAPGGSLEGP